MGEKKNGRGKGAPRAFQAERVGRRRSPALPVDAVVVEPRETAFRRRLAPGSFSPLDKRECRHRTFPRARTSSAAKDRRAGVSNSLDIFFVSRRGADRQRERERGTCVVFETRAAKTAGRLADTGFHLFCRGLEIPRLYVRQMPEYRSIDGVTLASRNVANVLAVSVQKWSNQCDAWFGSVRRNFSRISPDWPRGLMITRTSPDSRVDGRIR